MSLYRTVIEPEPENLWSELDEIRRYRDLFRFLVWRDLASRHRQSIVGIGWAVLRPLITVMIFTFVFSRVVGIETDGAPYPLFALTGLLPWLYFSGALGSAVNSIVGSGSLLQKVYFPRLILPLIGVVTGLADFAVQVVLLALLMIWYRHIPGWEVVWTPLFILLAATTALSVGLWLTALNVKYRDVGQAVPFALQAWMFLSPVIYSSHNLPENLRLLYGINPMVGIIEGFRWSVLGTPPPDWGMTTVSAAVVLLLLIFGLAYFRRTEATFADLV